LNLGAVSFLDLAAFATLASNCIAASPGPPVVVLLVHPEFLRRPAAEPRYLGWFSAMNSGDPIPAEDLAGRLRGFSGVEIFRDRIEPAFRPEPLPGAYGLRHGFGTRLVAALDADAGGLTDPHRYLPERRPATAPFDLSPRLGPQAAAFGRALAGKTSALLVGITPVPESLAGPDQAARHARVAETLAAWIGGGTRPLGLPATYPDARFASATHLDGPGRIDFTDRLSEALAKAGVVR
jgi:hypothetical protein